jgi:serine/threonine protein kinase
VLVTTAGDDGSLVHFRREAALLACVGRPGIANVHDVGLVDGRPYLVMDLIAGRRLSDLIAAGPLDEQRVAAIGGEVADALAAAHRAGLVHRDVKPDNILITPEGNARVIDFGLAARATDEHDGCNESIGPVSKGHAAGRDPDPHDRSAAGTPQA